MCAKDVRKQLIQKLFPHDVMIYIQGVFVLYPSSVPVPLHSKADDPQDINQSQFNLMFLLDNIDDDEDEDDNADGD